MGLIVLPHVIVLKNKRDNTKILIKRLEYNKYSIKINCFDDDNWVVVMVIIMMGMMPDVWNFLGYYGIPENSQETGK